MQKAVVSYDWTLNNNLLPAAIRRFRLFVWLSRFFLALARIPTILTDLYLRDFSPQYSSQVRSSFCDTHHSVVLVQSMCSFRSRFWCAV
jgi:hypothetical protein